MAIYHVIIDDVAVFEQTATKEDVETLRTEVAKGDGGIKLWVLCGALGTISAIILAAITVAVSIINLGN